MKICFINTTLFGTDGISRVLSCLASELSKTHDITVITFENPENVDRQIYNLSSRVHVEFWEPIYGKCMVRRAAHKINQKTGLLKKLNNEWLYDWTYLPKHMQRIWVQYINSNRFDAVVGVQAKGAYILGSIKDRISCKTFGWQHNSYEAYLENPGIYYWNQDMLFEKYIRRLDHYIVLNEHDAEMFYEKKNIVATAIYNPKSFVSDLKSDLTKHRFIALGGLRKAKGFDLLVESFGEFHERHPDWILDIYGDGEDKAFLEEKIQKAHMGEFIKLQGVTKDVSGEMLKSSALLLPSRWEGMPMVVLEALEMGLPVIAYNITAMTPLITDGKEGYIIPAFDTHVFAEAMHKVAASHELRTKMGENASVKAKEFDVGVIVKKWNKLLEDDSERN